MKTIFLLLVYLIGVFGSRYYFRKAYSKEGCWSNLYPNNEDLIMTFFPLVNIILFIIMSGSWKQDKKHTLAQKFFNVKK